jgi:hypothetical protein
LSDVTVFTSDKKTRATLDYATYHEAFSLSGKAMAGARATGNPEQLADLFMEEIKEALTRLAARISQKLYTGDGTTDEFAGLTQLALKSTGTYAGINRATAGNEAWRSNELLNGGVARELTMPLLNETRRQARETCGMDPDLIIGSPIQWDKYGEMHGGERRMVQEVSEVTLRGKKIVLDGGFTALRYGGMTFLWDVFCPDTNLLMLNTRHVGLKYLPDAPSKVNGGVAMMDIVGTEEEQFGGGSSKLRARMQELAKNGDLHKFSAFVYPMVKVGRPNSCVNLGDLAF